MNNLSNEFFLLTKISMSSSKVPHPYLFLWLVLNSVENFSFCGEIVSILGDKGVEGVTYFMEGKIATQASFPLLVLNDRELAMMGLYEIHAFKSKPFKFYKGFRFKVLIMFSSSSSL